jgi:hypothetical protein
MDTLADPPLADGAAITSTTETTMWSSSHFTPIFAFDPRPGKLYKVTAAGLLTMNTSAATITITPRIGTSVANGTTLGASGAQATNSAFVSKPWFLEFLACFRSVGDPGANSGVIGHGLFVVSQTTVATGSFAFSLGGTLATADVSINQAINLGVALSTGTMTTQIACIQSLN